MRLLLLTPPPSGSVVIQTENDGIRHNWIRFSYSCGIRTMGVPCIKPPRLVIYNQISRIKLPQTKPPWTKEESPYAKFLPIKVPLNQNFSNQNPSQIISLQPNSSRTEIPPNKMHLNQNLLNRIPLKPKPPK